MIIPIRLYKLKRIIRNQWTLFVSAAVCSLLLVIVLTYYARFDEQNKEVDLIQSEVQTLKNRYDTIKFNKSLTEEQVKEYNKILASLVPETEDFFSIIYALEEISRVSQFSITDYTIDVGNSSRERLTLSAMGTGDPEAFLTFLQEYQFAGGRLATSNKIQYGGQNSGNTRIALNFYNKKYIPNDLIKVPKLTQDEIAKLEIIKKKISFQFADSKYQSVSTDYAKKQNPFAGESQ